MSRINKRIPKVLALALSASVVASVGFADVSQAAAPASGTACQASDGKISGRGATFQTKAEAALIAGYTADVCGPVASDPDAGVNMIAYNYAAAASAGATGSGAGQKAASCRTDAFSGSDVPYDQATLAQINGAPGATGGCGIAFAPPFNPSTGPFPAAADAQKAVMSFPVAGSSVALGINLTAADCGGNDPGTINLTGANASLLASGDIKNWNDPRLQADSPGLANCNVAVTRVVRFDKSGTTQTYKNYLKNADGTRALCDGTSTWQALSADASNTVWPTGANCSALTRPATSGGGALVTLLQSTTGGIAYADLADWAGKGVPLANLDSANVNNVNFVPPASGSGANCSFGNASLPGTTPASSVGLQTSANWATDATNNRSDVTYKGDGYPICGLTWVFVYTGLNSTSTTGNAIARLTADQRRTLYSYFTYVLSPSAQARLANVQYAALPTSFLTRLRQGFQAGF